MNKIVLSFLLIFVLLSCKKSINYNFNYEGDKLALYGFISDNEGIWVDLYRSFSPFDTVRFSENIFVEDAIINLFEDDIFVGSLEKTSNKIRYRLNNFTPKQGKEYHFEASAADFEDIFTDKVTLPSTFILNPIQYQVDSVARDNFIGTLSYDLAAIIDYSIEDYESGEKYFMLEFDIYYQDTLLDRYSTTPKFLDYEDITTTCNFGITWFNNSCLGENNIDIEQTIYLEGRILNKYSLGDRIADKVVLNTRKINQTWYDRLNTEQSFQEDWTDGFGEPILYKTNIHGGYGWVSAFTSHLTEIEL